jgi:hypothetical protein
MFLICAGMHLSVASRLAGIVAILLQVPKAVKAGVILLFKKPSTHLSLLQ